MDHLALASKRRARLLSRTKTTTNTNRTTTTPANSTTVSNNSQQTIRPPLPPPPPPLQQYGENDKSSNTASAEKKDGMKQQKQQPSMKEHASATDNDTTNVINPITPHRKAKASVIFSEAAATASINRNRTTQSNTNYYVKTNASPMKPNDEEEKESKDEEEEDDDPLKSIHDLLSSIPTIDPSSYNNSATTMTTPPPSFKQNNYQHSKINDSHYNLPSSSSPSSPIRRENEQEQEMEEDCSEHVWLYRDFMVDKENDLGYCDATCIPHQSMVMLPNFYNGRTLLITSNNNNNNNNSTSNQEYGCGFSHPEECFLLDIVNSSTSTSSTSTRNMLRYGHIITLSCPVTTLALGVRKVTFDTSSMTDVGDTDNTNKKEQESYYQVGFFHPLCAQLEAEKWTVLPSHMNENDNNALPYSSSERNFLTIGTTAALLPISTTTNTKKNNNYYDQNKVFRKVSINDGIVLRNVLTGGLLTLQTTQQQQQYPNNDDNPNVYWTLLTSAYQQEQTQTRQSPQYNSWRIPQDRIIPSQQDTFCIRPIHLPPNYNHTLLYSNRWFLNFQHLQHPNRHHHNTAKNKHNHNIQQPHQIITLCSQNNDNDDDITTGTTTGTDDMIMIQEQLLLDEILGCMMGLEGRYIRATSINKNDYNDEIMFQLYPYNNTNNGDTIVGDCWDVSLVDLIQRMIPLCNQFVHVQKFVTCRLNGYEYGKVAHALCGAIDTLLQQYGDFCISLEQQFISAPTTNSSSRMTLLSLWAMIQPSMQTMAVLYNAVQVTQCTKGGSLLNSLEEIKQSLYFGNPKAQHILFKLLEQASVPYMQMLFHWLQSGTLADPYAEFMIQENINYNDDDTTTLFMDNDQDWDDWYMIREEHVLKVFTASPYSNNNYNSYNSSKNSNGQETFNFSPHLIHSDEADDMVRKVLTAGKYWNAIALCRKNNSAQQQRQHWLHQYSPKRAAAGNSSSDVTFSYWMNPVDMFQHVERAYTSSSQKFFTIVLKEQDLMSTLRFLKQYFLLDQGDFFVHFLDMAENELLQEMADVSRGRVQNWMNLSIQLCGNTHNILKSSNNNNNNNNNIGGLSHPHVLDIITSSLKCDFATASVVEHLDAIHSNNGGINSNEPKTPSRHLYGGSNKGLTGVEALMMDFEKMPFPLSLVLSRHTIEKYQLLFRHLFFAKHVERRLFGTWLDHQMIKEFQILRKELGPTYMLRQRMLHFMQNLVYYMMFEVIEPSWLRMEAKILQKSDHHQTTSDDFALMMNREEGNRTVDDILRTHKDFMRRILKECLLTNRDLIRTLTKLMTTCLLFSDQMKLFMKTTKIAEEQNAIATLERHRRHQRDGLTKKKIRQIYKSSMEDRKHRKQKQIDRLQHELNTESYKRMISRFEQVFNSNLSEFMTQLMSDNDGRYHTHLSNLCIRLDFNGYVTKSMNSTED